MEPSQTVLAIDIGGTKIAGGLVTADGVVHCQKTIPCGAKAGGEAVMRRVIGLAQELVRTGACEPGLAPQAIGVGTGGQVMLADGSIAFATAVLPGWGGMPVRRRLEEATGLPVQVENDANAMVIGEALFGAGRGLRVVVGITVGTGIGGGISIDQHIFHGAHGFSNNIGHMVIHQRGRCCACGQRGCLEVYASAPAMVRDFKRRVGHFRLDDEFGLGKDAFGVKEIAKLAQAGVPEAAATIAQGARYLGIGLASILNLIDPDIVVVGGGAALSGEAYLAQVRSTAHDLALPTEAAVPIVAAGLKNWANLVGAACIVWEKNK
jgi:glucokinase